MIFFTGLFVTFGETQRHRILWLLGPWIREIWGVRDLLLSILTTKNCHVQQQTHFLWSAWKTWSAKVLQSGFPRVYPFLSGYLEVLFIFLIFLVVFVGWFPRSLVLIWPRIGLAWKAWQHGKSSWGRMLGSGGKGEFRCCLFQANNICTNTPFQLQ